MDRRSVFVVAAWAVTGLTLGWASPVRAGPYSGPTDTGHATDPAIAADSASFVEWADAIDASRTAFAPRGSTAIDTAGGFNSLGDLDATEIVNGDAPGFLTVTFPTGISNGDGADFAVFENGFVFPSDPYLFMELAYVEVSSNGTDFARFPSVATNTTWQGTFGQAFGGFDATNVHNLAGKHANGFGTPFDLDDLFGDASVTSGTVDLSDIQYVRLVDLPGDGSFTDTQGHPILDAWLTNGTGGFDFRLGEGLGVGVIHAAAEASTAGDYDGDGFVGQGDLDLVLLNWGGAALPDGWAATGPFDGAIDQNELDGVLLNWGAGGTPRSAAAVPEPGASALVLASGLVCIRAARFL